MNYKSKSKRIIRLDHPLVNRVQRFSHEYNLLEEEDKILVAVSGGPDSVTLLHLLFALKEKYKFTLMIAHIEHGMRGDESKEEAIFVQHLGEELGLECFTHYVDVPELHKTSGCSIEETAREVRYRFLKETGQQIRATKIALGHTADDQAETLLMRLLRGSGLEGLAAMRPRREDNPPLVRPILNIFREEILEFLKNQNIPFRLDSTNNELRFLRNKIRWQLIPFLSQEYNPKIGLALHRTASILGEEREWLESVVKEKLKDCLLEVGESSLRLDVNCFLTLSLALQREVLRQAIQKIRPASYKIDFAKVSAILRWLKQGDASGSLALFKDLYLKKGIGVLCIEKKHPRTPLVTKNFCYSLNIPGETIIPELNLNLQTRIFERGDLGIVFGSKKAYLDFDSLTFPLYIRNKRAGDRFQPLGLCGTKKLKDFFIDSKIPKEKRSQVPLVVCGNRIVWVLEKRIAEPFKITERTKKVLLIEKIR